MNNPFDSCNSDKEIMKMVFELSATGKYNRQQLNIMASIRREELASSKVSTGIKLVKIIVPDSNDFLKRTVSNFVLSGNPKQSTNFTFFSDGRVGF